MCAWVNVVATRAQMGKPPRAQCACLNQYAHEISADARRISHFAFRYHFTWW